MGYIKYRFSRLFLGFGSELFIIIAGVTIALKFKAEIPLWVAFALIIMAVSIQIIIKNDLE